MNRENAHPPTGIQIGLLLVVCYLLIIVFVYHHINLVPAFLLNIIFTILFGTRLGYKWHDIEKRLAYCATEAFSTFIMILAVGLTIGIWIASGVLPALLYYGVTYISPQLYLTEAFIISLVTSVALGSIIAALGTAGILLLSIGATLNISLALAGGVILSGAIAGNILSPLSEMVILAVSIAQSNLRRYLVNTGRMVGISILIAVLLYSVLNLYIPQVDIQNAILQKKQQMLMNYNINPLLLFPLVLMLALSITRTPLLLSLFLNIIVSVLLGFLTQPYFTIDKILGVISGSFPLTGIDFLDSLVSRGNLNNYMGVSVLVLLAGSWGMLLKELGVVEWGLARFLIGGGNSCKDLMLRAMGMAFLLGVITCAVIPSVVISGGYFREKFKQAQVDTAHLSRLLLEQTLVLAPFFPWTNLYFMIQAALGINPIVSAPYYFIGWLVPLISTCWLLLLPRGKCLK
ncbi:transporter, NhaC family [Thermanaeromonas toyohensis ToBE]|uniref:Transporter, NhaC family n=1 Tax=Thermanaeromonas toyohensis ToBE TaxID=698762 RepID=A0A1W1VVG2_9FIRM|nr:Na+/H+ antiporter NhaC family protein [Thermanaeromonas toyohensis]SMB97230.1 transporter, NhaC family [Thermanaeromonas toyohensis ToBE]